MDYKKGVIIMSMEFECQKSVYTAMMANTTLTNLVSSRIYDEPPENLIYPYILIGGGGSIPHLRHEYDGIEDNFLITIFTQPGTLGFYPANEIAGEIKSSLHLKKLNISDSNLKNIITKEESLDRERAGQYRNIDLRYKMIIEKQAKEV
jgi:hypothetical protein